MSGERVYRVVIDRWPTPDGKPFEDQDIDWDDEWPSYIPATADRDRWLRGGGRGSDGAPNGEWYVAPTVRGRRFLSRSGAVARMASLAEYGIASHLEAAPVGKYTPTPPVSSPATTTRGEPS